jgi:RNA polymerase sigma-70 factor (ECF subfamily)
MSDLPVVPLFDDIYRLEYPGLVAVATAMTGDRDGAQDLVQDTMVRAFINWTKVSRLERPGAWCHHVLLNVCRSRLRRRATELRFASRHRHVTQTPEPTPDTVAFWTAVRTLPSRPRAVVALYFAGDLTSIQIGAILGIPEGTVRSDLAAARPIVMNALRSDRHV